MDRSKRTKKPMLLKPQNPRTKQTSNSSTSISSSTLTKPNNWPSSVFYVTSPLYAPSLTPSQLSSIRTYTPSPDIPQILFPSLPSPNVHILPITNPQHPAHSQAGLFAAHDLAPGSLIVPYLGLIHPGAGPGCDISSDYDLWLDREADVAVDAAKVGNEARFVNDYRGVPGRDGKRHNAEFREVWWTDLGEKGMGVFVLPAGKKAVGKARTVGVRMGEEILVSYGKGFWGGRRGGGEGGEEGGDGQVEG